MKNEYPWLKLLLIYNVKDNDLIPSTIQLFWISKTSWETSLLVASEGLPRRFAVIRMNTIKTNDSLIIVTCHIVASNR